MILAHFRAVLTHALLSACGHQAHQPMRNTNPKRFRQRKCRLCASGKAAGVVSAVPTNAHPYSAYGHVRTHHNRFCAHTPMRIQRNGSCAAYSSCASARAKVNYAHMRARSASSAIHRCAQQRCRRMRHGSHGKLRRRVRRGVIICASVRLRGNGFMRMWMYLALPRRPIVSAFPRTIHRCVEVTLCSPGEPRMMRR